MQYREHSLPVDWYRDNPVENWIFPMNIVYVEDDEEDEDED